MFLNYSLEKDEVEKGYAVKPYRKAQMFVWVLMSRMQELIRASTAADGVLLLIVRKKEML